MNKIFIGNIENITLEENKFRNVLYTTPSESLQLVVMSIKPGDSIGMEMHNDTDQFIRIEKGKGILVIGKNNPGITKIYDGMAFIIPRGTWHNVINIGKSEPLNLYSLYTPSHHPQGLVQKNKPIEEHSHNHNFIGNFGGDNFISIVILIMVAYFLIIK